MSFTILLAIIILVLIIVFAIVLIYKIHSPPSLERMFHDTTTDLDDIGGLLVNNFGTPWFRAMIQHGDVDLADTAVCASVNRHTCTAYSYIREDLIPMFFMFPGIALNVPCGIILSAKKAFPLITLMAVVDGDTNNRSCCTNESAAPILTRSPFSSSPADMCVYNTLLAKYGTTSTFVTKKYAVYIPLQDKGGNCPTSCNGDLNCMYNNSGGSINQWMMNSSPACIAGQYKDCFDFTEIAAGSVPETITRLFPGDQPDGYLIQSISSNCPTCSKPYLCVPQEYKPADKYEIVEEDTRIATYIGEDGNGYQSTITGTMDIGTIAITQCRFERKDWNLWVSVLKQHYRNLLALLKSDNSMVARYNYQLANPTSPSYFENEVNFYIDPDTSTSEYKKQNNIYQHAIVGFYYTGITCEDQLKTLNGITTTAGTATFNDSVDRCDTFFQMDDPTLTTATRRQWEVNNIESSRELVHQVAAMFNKKHGKHIPVYTCTADSNAFPNYQSMTKALKGEIKFSSIFQKDTSFHS